MINFEEEIAKRDARIAELEADRDRIKTIADNYCALNMDAQVELAALKAQQPSVGGAYSSDPLACSGCAAGRFRCRSSAGVVIGALVSALEGIAHDERVPNEVSQDYAALLIEARRLNPCRAQAVPDDCASVPVAGLKQVHRDLDACQKVIWLVGGFDPAYCEDAQARLKDIEGWLAAAPSAKKESGDE